MDLTNKLKNFPHAYYFNLDNRPDRKSYMQNQFSYWKIEYTRISGSNFLSSNIGEWGRQFIEGDVPGIPAYCLGNTITHLEFLKTWINTSDDDYVLLMEDDYDLNLIEYWNFDWEYLMDRLPYDWDCIQLGFESKEFIPFFLHPKLRHSYYGPVLLTRSYVEKILDIHAAGDKYVFNKHIGLYEFNGSYGTVDYFIGHTGRTYSIPLITTNNNLASTEFGIEIEREHHEKSRSAYYVWWMRTHLKFSLDEFFTYGKENDAKMVVSTSG